MQQSVAPETLDKYLRIITNRILENNPELKDQPGLAEKLIEDTTQLLRYKEKTSKTVLTKEMILNTDFMNQLTRTIIAEATLNGSEEQKKFIEDLILAMNELKHNNTYKNELKSFIHEQEALLNDLTDLMSEVNELMKMDPVMLDKMQQKLRKKFMNKVHKKLLLKLEKILNLRFNPGNKMSLRDALRKLFNEIKANIAMLKKNGTLDKTQRPVAEDVYMNLFGLLNSFIAGTIAVPITQYLGNGIGFVDWNPNHGYANIDRISELNFMYGDPLGLEADILKNFFAIEGDVVNSLCDLLRAEGLEPEHIAITPRALDIGKGPPTTT